MIEIDYRESKIIELIKQGDFSDYNTINLPIGDFIIKSKNIIHTEDINNDTEDINNDTEDINNDINNDININTKDIEYIIERKSISDLSASISDGRFRCQKQRLMKSNLDPSKIIYIIEGKYTKSCRIPKSTIDSAILNLIFKHNFRVIFTETPEHTLSHILLLYKKIQNKELLPEKNSIPNINIKLIKKSDLHMNTFVNMLSVIPGVSMNIANKINEKYKNLSELIEELKNNPDSLNSIQITDKRKLGNALSKKIYKCLINK